MKIIKKDFFESSCQVLDRHLCCLKHLRCVFLNGNAELTFTVVSLSVNVRKSQNYFHFAYRLVLNTSRSLQTSQTSLNKCDGYMCVKQTEQYNRIYTFC